MCLKDIGVHKEKQNCPNENTVYEQDWHHVMIHQVWTGWKLGDASLNYEENVTYLAGTGIICTQNQLMCTSRLIMDDNLSKTVEQQRNRYDSNKIIEYLDSDSLFEVNFVTLHYLDIGIVAH